MCPSVRSHLTNLDIRSINSDHFPWNLLLEPTTFLPLRWQHLSLSLTGVATREREILNSREMNDLLPPQLCKEVAQNRFFWDRRIDIRRYGRSIPDAMNRFFFYFFCQSSFGDGKRQREPSSLDSLPLTQNVSIDQFLFDVIVWVFLKSFCLGNFLLRSLGDFHLGCVTCSFFYITRVLLSVNHKSGVYVPLFFSFGSTIFTKSFNNTGKCYIC